MGRRQRSAGSAWRWSARSGASGAFGLAALLLAVAPSLAAEPRCVVDDTEQQVCLDAPAARIVSLSPGTTELLFAAGAGERIVASVSHADYPAEAEALPRIGSYQRIDLEALLATRPDLVVAWYSGNRPSTLERLERLGIPVYRSEQRQLKDIATTLERYGRLAGVEAHADEAAAAFRQRLAALETSYSARPSVRVFYQIWDDPVMTVNDDQIISESLRVCGGENVFGELDRLTPRIDVESVLAADPEVIISGGMGEANDAWLEAWRRFSSLTAVEREQLHFVPPSLVQRPTPRMLAGTARICEILEQARARRE